MQQLTGDLDYSTVEEQVEASNDHPSRFFSDAYVPSHLTP